MLALLLEMYIMKWQVFTKLSMPLGVSLNKIINILILVIM